MRPVRKAVFPVAGMGTRFLPATKAMPKQLLPVVDKPLIQYAVEEAVAAGITDLIFQGQARAAGDGAGHSTCARQLPLHPAIGPARPGSRRAVGRSRRGRRAFCRAAGRRPDRRRHARHEAAGGHRRGAERQRAGRAGRAARRHPQVRDRGHARRRYAAGCPDRTRHAYR
ncbi:hypothetical protein G6F57_020930 [Rhizopus arrhizus]|nr:hypothetical protein G6F57_020930 [Rhizopus arrhizus]